MTGSWDADVLSATLQEAPRRWGHVDVCDVVDSTNARALRDPRPWSIVAAAGQDAGRGRRGRAWVMPHGVGAAMSMTVPVPGGDAAGWLPLLTGLAVREALTALLPSARFDLKWPNDVLAAPGAGDAGAGAAPAKICGILCQAAVPSAPVVRPASGVGSGDSERLVVAGVGVNVAMDRAELPVPTATSLRLIAGLDEPVPTLAAVVLAVADAFEARHAAWLADDGRTGRLREEYRGVCTTLGADVEVHLPGERRERGRAVDVAPGGELLVVPEGATAPRPYAAGDVVHLRPGAGGSGAR